MNIALVSTAVGTGGAEQYLVELAEWLATKRIGVRLVVAEEIAEPIRVELRGAKIEVQIAPIGWDYGPEDNLGGPAYRDKLEQQRAGMAAAIARVPRLDLVLFNANWPTHYIGAMQAAAAASVPFGVHFHLCPHQVHLNPLALSTHAEMLPRATFLSCVSRNNRFFLERTFGALLEFQVVLNGSRFEVTPAERAELMRRPRANQFLIVGRLDHQKGVLDMLPALGYPEQFRGAEVQFLGDGPLRAAVEAALAELPLPARVLGVVSNIRDRLSEAEAMILPSHFEGLSLSILEAMSLGCVPIVSRASSATEVIEDGVNGFLFDVGDWRSMLRAINRFHACNRAQVRKSCLTQAQRFSRNGMLQKMQALLQGRRLG